MRRGNIAPAASLIGLAIALVPLARQAQAQTAVPRNPTDRSLSASLLAASIPAPSSPVWIDSDSQPDATHHRVELAYANVRRRDLAGTEPLAIVGFRTEQTTHDTTGSGAGILGARLGLRTGDGARPHPIAAAELYAGFRGLGYLHSPALPDLGFDFTAGWGNLGNDGHASIGVRMPVEWVRRSEQVRVSVFVAPTLAWGYVRLRECEDMGDDDGCGDLGVQLAFGQTRYLFAGGASLTIPGSGLSVSGGAQRLLAPGETTRLWGGVTWGR